MKLYSYFALKIALIVIACFQNAESTRNLGGSANLITKEGINSSSMARQDILGGTNNFSKDNVSAITYGLGDVGGYTLPPDSTTYKSPTMMGVLPTKFELPKGGVFESIDEIPSAEKYYDGSTNLNSVKLSCKIYATSDDCLKNSSCGWCGSSNLCILGNNLGPLQSCTRSSFLYSSPIPNINKQLVIEKSDSPGVDFTLENK